MPASRTHLRRTALGILAMALDPMMRGLALGQSQQIIRLNVLFSAGTGLDLLARIWLKADAEPPTIHRCGAPDDKGLFEGMRGRRGVRLDTLPPCP